MRRSTAFSSGATVGAPSATRNTPLAIYNVFPDIDDPLARAYYLPLVDGVFHPPFDQATEKYRHQIAWHELTHVILSSTGVICALRNIANAFTAALISFLMRDDVILYIPSFLIRDHAGNEYTYLKAVADKYESLANAMMLVQEIVTAAVQLEASNRDPVVEVDIRANIEWMEERFHLQGVYTKIFSDFANLYKRIGILGAYAICEHVFHTHDLTIEAALESLRSAIEVANTYPETDDPGAPAGVRIAWFFYFANYLNRNLHFLPRSYCPIAYMNHVCIPEYYQFHLYEQLQDNTDEFDFNEDTRMLLSGYYMTQAHMMEFVRCGQSKPGWWFDTHDLREVVNKWRTSTENRRQEHERMILREAEGSPAMQLLEFGRKAEVPGNDPRNLRYLVSLNMVEEQRNQFKIVFDCDPAETEWLGPDTSDVVFFEAIRQQLWAAQGPKCFCRAGIGDRFQDNVRSRVEGPLEKLCIWHRNARYVRETGDYQRLLDPAYTADGCPYRPLLRRLWEKTRADEGSGWKSEGKPPCLCF